MRIFIALPLSVACRQALIDACAALRTARPGLRWVRPEQLHLTLAFLGDIDEGRLASVGLAVRRAVAERAGADFVLRACGLATFPPRSRAAVLAAAIGDGAAEATLLADGIERGLERAGAEGGVPFRPRERRPYTPHITLARAGRPGVLLTAAERATPLACSCTIDVVTVYQSILDRGGSRYEALDRIPLRSC